MENQKEYFDNLILELRNECQNMDYELERNFKETDELLPKYTFVERDAEDLKDDEVFYIYVGKPSTHPDFIAVDESKLKKLQSPLDGEDFGYILDGELILKIRNKKLYPLVEGNVPEEIVEKFMDKIYLLSDDHEMEVDMEDVSYLAREEQLQK